MRFAISGSRDIFLKRIQKNIADLDAQKHVKILGFVPDENLVDLYKNSIGFIYPSLSEGFGLQGLEAMAAGGLVLASDIAVFKEVYKDNVMYFNPYDFSSIAKSMRDAVELDKGKRKKIIKKGQKFVQKYSWTKMAKETLKIYREVMYGQ